MHLAVTTCGPAPSFYLTLTLLVFGVLTANDVDSSFPPHGLTARHKRVLVTVTALLGLGGTNQDKRNDTPGVKAGSPRAD